MFSVSCPAPPVPPAVARPLPFFRTLRPSLTPMRGVRRAETWSDRACDFGESGQRRKRVGLLGKANYYSVNLGELGRPGGLSDG